MKYLYIGMFSCLSCSDLTAFIQSRLKLNRDKFHTGVLHHHLHLDVNCYTTCVWNVLLTHSTRGKGYESPYYSTVILRQLCFCSLETVNLALLCSLTSHLVSQPRKWCTQEKSGMWTLKYGLSRVFCPYLRLLDRLSSVSLVTTTWVEPPWLSSCITSICDTNTHTGLIIRAGGFVCCA